ncbi:MAG: hypothetical protein QOH46_2518 [Solirubrobacteraceae bacterium]|nr:hypothetical protein [Solirubrobacteraceae bacterium]
MTPSGSESTGGPPGYGPGMSTPSGATQRRPSSLVLFLRYILPTIICISGIVVAFARGWDETGVEACAAMFAAGTSLYLMNVLMRAGITGDQDRDREDEARAYFDKHGRWPDE